jgi:16S rRNA (adenine1518-N6/adenine1519-N6)-dimethyltransferase
MTAPHKPRKRFGQHFLVDTDIIERIVEVIAPSRSDTMVEIGPGEGAITGSLAERAGTLHAIEFDRDLAGSLKRRYAANEHVHVHEADALKFRYDDIGGELRIAGNLPYNLSTPLLFHLVGFRHSIRDMHFMLQKEVVDRITAEPGSKSYGRLTVMLACYMESVPLFDVGPDAFRPPPRVMSSVFRMRPHALGKLDIKHPRELSSLVLQAFSKRRKTMRNALKGTVSESQLVASSIDPGSRPEQVAVENWIALSAQFASCAELQK